MIYYSLTNPQILLNSLSRMIVVCHTVACISNVSVSWILILADMLSSVRSYCQCTAGLLLGWVTVCGRVNHLGM